MLIVRDLVWYGPARFKDFATHNVGIPPALLTERLRTLEASGHVSRTDGVYRINDPDGSLRALVDGLATFGMTLIVAGDPTMESLQYLARRVTSIHRDKLRDIEPFECNVVIGSTEVGVTVGDGAVMITEPYPAAPTVVTSAAEFARLVTGQLAATDLSISRDRPRIAEGLRLLRVVA